MSSSLKTSSNLVGKMTKLKPYLAVIFMQFGEAGLAIIAKSALNQGMSHYVFTVYRNFIAAVAIAPFALFFDRKVRPKMTMSIFLKIMLLGLIEPVISQNFYYAGMKCTSPTFNTALANTLPALTFVLSWILWIERVQIREMRSQAKILGTLVTVGGATIMTLVKGPNIELPWTKQSLHHHATATLIHPSDNSNIHNIHSNNISQKNLIEGAFMIFAACLTWAIFYILQGNTLKSHYPVGLSLTCLICTVGSLQGAVVALVAERGNPSAWALHWDTKLLAYVYSGIICSATAFYLSGIIMKAKGPVFLTAFTPLSMVIVVIISSFILADQLDFGRVLGAGVIIIGLYMVIWGKKKDHHKDSSPKSSTVDDKESPTKSTAGDDEAV